MFVDASAIVPMISREPDADELATRLESHPRRTTSAVALYEASAALARKHGWTPSEALGFVMHFCEAAELTIMSMDAEVAKTAVAAFDRYGKGRHPARLNMGDCFAYACARVANEPLLFKGNDFTLTDIVSA